MNTTLPEEVKTEPLPKPVGLTIEELIIVAYALEKIAPKFAYSNEDLLGNPTPWNALVDYRFEKKLPYGNELRQMAKELDLTPSQFMQMTNSHPKHLGSMVRDRIHERECRS